MLVEVQAEIEGEMARNNASQVLHTTPMSFNNLPDPSVKSGSNKNFAEDGDMVAKE